MLYSLRRFFKTVLLLVLLPLVGLLVGCEQQMADQPRYDPLEPSRYYADGQSFRPVPAHTIARGGGSGGPMGTGKKAGLPSQPASVEATAGMPLAQALAAVDQSVFVTEFPIPVSEPMLHRGSDRFQIFCTPCHGSSGYGGGPVVQRGFPPPPSFHQPRLRDVPVGYLFHVISQGHGKMPGFEAVVSVEDRWAIAAFVRVLQFSQHARLEQLPAAVREPFQNLPRPDPPRAAGESDEPPVAKESS